MIFGLIAWVGIATQAQDSCSLADSVGFVDRIQWIGGNRGGPKPTVVTGSGATERLEDVDLLCPSDLVLNPPGSAQLVVLRISGERIAVSSGTPAFKVPKPGWLSASFTLASKLLDAFGSYDRGRQSLRPVLVRGPSLACEPLNLSRSSPVEDVFIDEAVHLKWSCPASEKPLNVRIRGNRKDRILPLEAGAVSFLPTEDCETRCEAILQDSGGKPLGHVSLKSHSREELDEPIASQIRGDAPDRALAGMTFFKSQGWKLAGASIVLTEACRFPRAASVAMTIYRLSGPEEICVAASYTR